MNLKPLRPDQQQKAPARWNYQKNSEDFISWVNRLGIERTFVGRIAHKLDERFKLRRLLLVFLFSLVLSFLISFSWEFDTFNSSYKEGDLAAADIKSPLSFEVVDETETHRRRMDAEESIPPVYDYEWGLYDQLVARVRGALREMRTHYGEGSEPKNNKKELASRQAEFESGLGGIRISKETFEWLAKQKFKPSIETAAVQTLERIGNQKIVEDALPLRQSSRKRIIVNVLERGFKGEEFIQDSTQLIDATEVRRKINNQTEGYGDFADSRDVNELNDFIGSLIVPNLTLNKQETEFRRQHAREAVAPFIVQIKKGQTIIHEGQPFLKVNVASLDEIKRLKKTGHQDFVALIMAVFFTMLIRVFFSFITRFSSKVKVSMKDAAAMGAILLTNTIVIKFMLFVANEAFVDRFPRLHPSFYLYILPVTFGAMMVGLLIPFGEVVWLYSIFWAIVAGFVAEHSYTFMIITFATSMVAARGVYGCKKREDIYWAGIKTGLVAAGLIFLITLMEGPRLGLAGSGLLWSTPAGFISGLLSCFIALTLIPLWENIFIYTTDVKLLELSNLNHPLLKDLIVKAPGTYHHSLVVGSMCEAAAEGIGANPLLAKVCAYYHDIGKTDHAQYFIENQRPGENRHDQISPGMSKTILVAHVKDGVEKGLKYKLGRSIIDVIEQHHGTTLISFFYHKAKETEDSEMHEVSEDEYRYPGPRPQFREAALCMLADSIEAAARSLDEPTPARLQGIVKNIVQKKFLDGQLEDCNITLKDLTVIEEAFGRILLGIYHQRIDYPTGPKASPGAKRSSPGQPGFSAS